MGNRPQTGHFTQLLSFSNNSFFDNQPRRSAQSVPTHASLTGARPAPVAWRGGKTSWAGGIEPPANMRLLPGGEAGALPVTFSTQL